MWKKIVAWWNKLVELDEAEWRRLREKAREDHGIVAKDLKSTVTEVKDDVPKWRGRASPWK